MRFIDIFYPYLKSYVSLMVFSVTGLIHFAIAVQIQKTVGFSHVVYTDSYRTQIMKIGVSEFLPVPVVFNDPNHGQAVLFIWIRPDKYEVIILLTRICVVEILEFPLDPLPGLEFELVRILLGKHLVFRNSVFNSGEALTIVEKKTIMLILNAIISVIP